MEHLAPYTFAMVLTGIVAALVMPFAQQDAEAHQLILVGIIAGLALISLLLLWLIKTHEFTAHRVHRSRIVRNYLAAAASSVPDADDGDIDLGSLAEPTFAAGPYPLFGAALEVAEIGADSSAELRRVPFLFSPLYSGFDVSSTRESKYGVAEAYRPSNVLGGGISLATAIAISQPIRRRSFRPPSAAAAMLWTIFNMRDGRYMGNPTQDTWSEHGPLVEPIYALREGDLATEAPFVRPSPSEDFDNLGIFQLVKRRCRFIIACDSTNDPDFAFQDLGDTIRRCLTELGVEIQMDLGPLGRTPASSTAHCQIAQIRYPTGEEGMMVYIKPSLTGDEPTSLVQHARVHPEFPATEVTGRFNVSDFESYRGLGQHIVESLLDGLQITPEMPTSQVFSLIRRQLNPDYKEAETASALGTGSPAITIPQELVDAIASGECVLCAGSGLAAQAKVPTWSAFLDGLLRTARENGLLDTVTANGLSATLAAGDYETVADELSHQLPRELVLEHMRSVTSGSEPSRAHQLLAGMMFFGALNLNFDDLLATSFNSRGVVASEAERLLGALQSKRFFIANVFGSVSRPPSVLLTMKEFRQLLLTNSQVKQFLGTLFLRYTVVFVGVSIDGIREFIDALELVHAPERRHYAIIPNASLIDPVRVRVFERSFNIRVVDYQPQFNFTGLPEFLDRLQTVVKENSPRSKATGPLTLKSITVENIGPFHSLHLDFTSQWNLLLGDNGVGKTVLLKAIAAALCGDKADSASVARLLRIGASKGSIRLKDENREYTVELERKIDGTIQVVSASLSPIIYEGWLALGFPALRSVAVVNPKGPKPLNRKAPSADDLLPLLRGEPDNRVADIKQWLVNLDYAIKSGDPLGQARRLMHDFFKVLRLLTPGLRLDQGQINSKTMEITVVTDSGVVPLELLSQGTGSVMCWIGSLLERLSETGNARDAALNSALVLIDELDAHMHPKWQQMFVDTFRQEFKSVQIIATTHSPLLVGSLKPDEIWRLHRGPLTSEIYGVAHLGEVVDGKREVTVVGTEGDEEGELPSPPETVVYSIPAGAELLVQDGDVVEAQEALTNQDDRVLAERVRSKEDGWRADQILTSQLFGMETTRDPETANMLSEFTRLTALDDLEESERTRLTQLGHDLQIRLATPLETEAARKAFSLIREFATKRLTDLPPQERRKVLDEVKVQLTESITGSPRPE
jgi:hypothetical protein